MSQDNKLRTTFNKVVELYDLVRPHYPEQLFDSIVKVVKLDQGARLLEIGPGTGQATEPFARRGYDITAIELGADLADFTRKKLADYEQLKIITGTFEETELESRTFDLIYSATAFHWIKPAVKFSKPYDLLKSDGHLAIIHTNNISAEKDDKFFYALQPIYKKYRPGEEDLSGVHIKLVEDLKPDNYDENYFEQVLFEVYPFSVRYSAKRYAQLVNTYSATILMKPEKRISFLKEIEELIEGKFGGSIQKYFATTLTLLRKKDY